MPLKVTEIKLKTVTPLFTSGADQDRAEIRASAIKGAIRFWWRFLYGGAEAAWDELAAKESRLFGWAGDAKGRGRSPVAIRVVGSPGSSRTTHGWSQDLLYSGYGVTEWRDRTVVAARPFIPPGAEFSLRLLWSPDVQENDARQILCAVWAMCHVGGFGSRARRGWGCLSLESVEGAFAENLPRPIRNVRDRYELTDKLEHKLRCLALPCAKQPEFTALSTTTVVRCVRATDRNWLSAAGWIASQLRQFRGAKPADPDFPNDSDEVKKYLATGARPVNSGSSRRAVFGLPHNYFFKQWLADDMPAEKAVISIGNGKGRRSSPLFIRIHPVQLGAQQGFAVVLMYVPSPFLPDGADVSLVPSSKSRTKTPPLAVPWALEVDPECVKDFINFATVNGQ